MRAHGAKSRMRASTTTVGSGAILAAACLAGIAIWWAAERIEQPVDVSGGMHTTLMSPGAVGSDGAVSATPSESLYSHVGWTYLGSDNAGAPTSSLVADAASPQALYALSSMGAVFRSTDGAATWKFASQLPLHNGKLEASPDQGGVLYAYTSYYEGSTSYSPAKDHVNPSAGIYRSTDAGATWTEIRAMATSSVTPGQLTDLNRLRAVSGQPQVLFAASESGGLLRTGDSGVTWHAVAAADGARFRDCTELEVAASQAKVYAICARQPVVVGLDGTGATRLLRAELADDSTKLKIAVAPSDQRIIYLTSTHSSEGHSRLINRIYRSTDGGASWEMRFRRAMASDVTPPENSDNPFNIALPGIFGRDCSNPSPYNYFEDYALAVDPRDANRLWVAGGQTYRSDDGGRTFGLASLALESGRSGIVFPPSYNGSSDQRFFTAGPGSPFEPGGIQRSAAGRAAVLTYPGVNCQTITWAPPPGSNTAPAHVGYSAAQYLDGTTFDYHTFLVSSRHTGTAVGDDRSTTDWAAVHARGGEIVANRGSQLDSVYVTGGNTVTRATWLPDRAGWGWSMAYPPSYPTRGFTLPFRKQLGVVIQELPYYQIDQHPFQSNTLVIATYDGALITTDGGRTWKLQGPAEAMQHVAFQHDGSMVAVTLDGYFVTESPKGSGVWEMRDANGCLRGSSGCSPRLVSPQRIVRSPVPGSKTLYAAGSRNGGAKVLMSTDGRVWQALDRPGQAGGLPEYRGMTSLAIDPSNPSHLYVGTPFGLYATTDNGQTWLPMATPFPGTAVSKLTIERDAVGNRRLFAFTYGRGAWFYQMPQSTTFADVPIYHWANDFIGRLFRAGITSGCATDPLQFCPDHRVTRDQMAVFLLRARNGSAYRPPAATGVFADVPTGHWAASWIEQLRTEGVTSGCSSSPLQFCPNSEVTRDQMAVFLLRSKHGSDYRPPAPTGMFEDVPAAHWAAPWIEQLARDGVTGGCSSVPRLYCPSAPVTRDQMAVFLVKAYAL